MSFRIGSLEEILNYFNLRNSWLNSKRSAKLSHSDDNAHVFFVEKETFKFVIEIHWKTLYPFISAKFLRNFAVL